MPGTLSIQTYIIRTSYKDVLPPNSPIMIGGKNIVPDDLSVKVEVNSQPSHRVINLLKYRPILMSLPKNALQKSVSQLETIRDTLDPSLLGNLEKDKVELEAEFKKFAEKWRVETGMLSLVTQKSMHQAYQRIIGMGQPVIPLILRDLEQKPDHWFWALRAITGDNPVKPEQRGRMKQMAQAWIQWGKEHGYEW
ncbi:hypothetical protein Q5692_18840 [Microcoleus sp. C2C3]|uniref:hypothetical protein n=1 Tax=unclassified Microcoleus TaxID=2642155 RepID=UPI002FD5615F